MANLTSQNRVMLGLHGVQWMVFILANVIAAPIVVGAAFDLPAAEISTLVQRMLFLAGGATLLQAFIGHRMILIEGTAGMWWALFVLMAAMTPSGQQGLVLRQLEMGMIVAGVVLVVLAQLPLMQRIRELFTPITTGVFLILLCIQLAGSFFKGMLGVARYGQLDGVVTSLSLLVVVIVLTLALKGKGLLRSMGPLIGIGTGWFLFDLFGLLDAPPVAAGHQWFALPELFAWGVPVWDVGIVLTSVLTSVILISNLVASIVVVGNTLEQPVDAKTFQRGVFGNGISGLLTGTFGAVGLVPLSVSAGFMMTTGIRTRAPFLLGALLVMLAGLFPAVGQYFATLPSEVAYAALFVPFSQMIGFGIRDLMGLEPSPRNLLVIGLTIMVGAGIMFLPPEAFASLAPWARNVLANGLLVGLLFCLLLEHVVFRKK